MLSFLQAILMGILQGFSELFPISSLGHAVIFPALLGWDNLVSAQSADESFFLAFLVGLHVATAIALLVYFREDWKRIIRGFFRTLGSRKMQTPDERLAWLLIVATVPVGLTGLLLEHPLRVLFAKPLAAAIFLSVNSVILFAGERLRRRSEVRQVALAHGSSAEEDRADGGPARRLETLEFKEALIIGVFQTFALLAGISRSGITMVAGLVRGMDHEDAARFSFLLATPVILAAGLYKIPSLLGPLTSGIRMQVIVGSICAGVTAYFSVRFLMRYFESKTLTPFAIYCLFAGVSASLYFGVIK